MDGQGCPVLYRDVAGAFVSRIPYRHVDFLKIVVTEGDRMLRKLLGLLKRDDAEIIAIILRMDYNISRNKNEAREGVIVSQIYGR